MDLTGQAIGSALLTTRSSAAEEIVEEAASVFIKTGSCDRAENVLLRAKERFALSDGVYTTLCLTTGLRIASKAVAAKAAVL